MVNKRKKRTTRYKKFHKATEAETEKKKTTSLYLENSHTLLINSINYYTQNVPAVIDFCSGISYCRFVKTRLN